jgi:hypothetical protein
MLEVRKAAHLRNGWYILLREALDWQCFSKRNSDFKIRSEAYCTRFEAWLSVFSYLGPKCLFKLLGCGCEVRL